MSEMEAIDAHTVASSIDLETESALIWHSFNCLFRFSDIIADLLTGMHSSKRLFRFR
jgi:hypothetical protein